MMRVFRFFSCLAAALSCAVLSPAVAQTTASSREYARVYVENRCYHTVDLAIEREKENLVMPPVSPRDTEIVLFTWTKNILPEEIVRLSRRNAADLRVSVGELLEGARQEEWTMGRHVVRSWFVTVCKKERALDDPVGASTRRAKEGEIVAEYEMLFTRVAGSSDPMHIFSSYPVRLSLNGTPLKILTTSKDGVLRFLLPKEAVGTMTLEAAPDITHSLELGKDWLPVRNRRAKAGEMLLMEPELLGGLEDW